MLKLPETKLDKFNLSYNKLIPSNYCFLIKGISQFTFTQDEDGKGIPQFTGQHV
jgi:hypothetical protein